MQLRKSAVEWKDVSTFQIFFLYFLDLGFSQEFIASDQEQGNKISREHSYMTSDFWVGRYVKVHLMISDVGRWVGQRGSDVRSAIF